MTLSSWVCNSHGWKVGISVGFALLLESNVSGACERTTIKKILLVDKK